jgi:hypothetical protein
MYIYTQGLCTRTKQVLVYESLREEPSWQTIIDLYDLRPELGIQK